MLNLKSEAEKIDSPGKKKMAKFYTKKVKETTNGGSVLSLGCCSDVDNMVAKNCGLKYSYTVGDLDYQDWYVSERHVDHYENVFMFGVIEHLMNPLFCFEDFKKSNNRRYKNLLINSKAATFFLG